MKKGAQNMHHYEKCRLLKNKKNGKSHYGKNGA
jgi:hypothetical protein